MPKAVDLKVIELDWTSRTLTLANMAQQMRSQASSAALLSVQQWGSGPLNHCAADPRPL